MKTVIDAIHEDIQKHSRNEEETVSASSSQYGSSQFSSTEERKDSHELKRIESYMADATDRTSSIDGNVDEEATRRCMAGKLSEFDEVFENAGKDKASRQNKTAGDTFFNRQVPA
jgi:hypothetical protein